MVTLARPSSSPGSLIGWVMQKFLLKADRHLAEPMGMAFTTLRTRPSRRVSSAIAVVAALTMLTGCLAPGQSDVQSALNKDRTDYGRRALSIQDDAQRKAQAWAEKLARENRLYHSKLSDGIKTKWCSLGENVGYGKNVPTVQKAYMESTGHRANVMATKWNGVGVGHATNGSRVFTVQVFIQTC